jgi:hypothetical protein
VARAQESPPAPEGYSHYWPGSCVEAVTRNDLFERRGQTDTTRFDPDADTMLTNSVQVARTCVASLVIDSIQTRDLILLARAYLAAGDSSEAQGAIERRLSADAARPDSTRAHDLADVVELYLEAKPSRRGEAQWYMERLDTLSGPDVAYWQFRAHDASGRYARRAGDEEAMRRDANAIIAAATRLSPHDRQEFAGRIVSAYWVLADLAGTETGQSDTARHIIAHAQADVGQIDDADHALQLVQFMANQFGRHSPSVYADTWFPPEGTESADSIHPRPGKVSVVVMGTLSRSAMPAFRRIQTILPDTVDITFIHNSYGYFASQGPLTPAEEAVVAMRYFRNDLKAPGTLAIVVPRFEVLPDGRRIAVPTRNEVLFGARMGVGIVVIDRQGLIRRTFSGFEPWTEREIETLAQKIQ